MIASPTAPPILAPAYYQARDSLTKRHLHGVNTITNRVPRIINLVFYHKVNPVRRLTRGIIRASTSPRTNLCTQYSIVITGEAILRMRFETMQSQQFTILYDNVFRTLDYGLMTQTLQ